MRRFFSIVLCLLSFLLIFLPICSASNYTPYASVTSSTSNINMLMETMFNQTDFNPFQDWIGIRTGQYDYSVFYNIHDGYARRIRYYGQTSGYNTDWYLTFSEDRNFTYDTNGFTIVGSTPDSLGSASYRTYFADHILYLTVPAILIVLLFSIFRFRKSKRGVRV